MFMTVDWQNLSAAWNSQNGDILREMTAACSSHCLLPLWEHCVVHITPRAGCVMHLNAANKTTPKWNNNLCKQGLGMTCQTPPWNKGACCSCGKQNQHGAAWGEAERSAKAERIVNWAGWWVGWREWVEPERRRTHSRMWWAKAWARHGQDVLLNSEEPS